MRAELVLVQRFNHDGQVFHQAISQQPVEVTTDGIRMWVSMPFRYWIVPTGGRLEISAWEVDKL